MYSLAGNERTYEPLMLVIVPLDVPEILTLTAAIGTPVLASVTIRSRV